MNTMSYGNARTQKGAHTHTPIYICMVSLLIWSRKHDFAFQTIPPRLSNDSGPYCSAIK